MIHSRPYTVCLYQGISISTKQSGHVRGRGSLLSSEASLYNPVCRLGGFAVALYIYLAHNLSRKLMVDNIDDALIASVHNQFTIYRSIHGFIYLFIICIYILWINSIRALYMNTLKWYETSRAACCIIGVCIYTKLYSSFKASLWKEAKRLRGKERWISTYIWRREKWYIEIFSKQILDPDRWRN